MNNKLIEELNYKIDNQDKIINDLQQRLNVVNEMNIANYNSYCEEIKKNQHLQDQLDQALKDYDKELQKNSKTLNYINERKEYKSEPFYLDEIQTEIVEDILKGKFNE